jgi:hypothetical protein
MKVDNALASLAVKDLKAASPWYGKLFRRPADSTSMPEVAEWRFERGGWLQVYRARHFKSRTGSRLRRTIIVLRSERLRQSNRGWDNQGFVRKLMTTLHSVVPDAAQPRKERSEL